MEGNGAGTHDWVASYEIRLLYVFNLACVNNDKVPVLSSVMGFALY